MAISIPHITVTFVTLKLILLRDYNVIYVIYDCPVFEEK